MKNEAHIMRKAQYITRYGPGSIIETKNESRLILSMKLGYKIEFNQDKLEQYEISDPRLLTLLKKNKTDKVGILNLPTNESENLGSMDEIYRTKRFPHWYICHNNHNWEGKNLKSVLFKPTIDYEYKCPICNNEIKNCSSVRFVLACVNGHLDDVHWDVALHREKHCRRLNEQLEFYEWVSYGPDIEQIYIKCPYCKKIQKTMLEIFFTNFNCSGLFQEEFSGHFEFKQCNKPMKIIQKSSSSLRLPNNISFLSLPEYHKRLGRLFFYHNHIIEFLYDLLKNCMDIPDDSIKSILENYCKNHQEIEDKEAKYLLNHSKEEIIIEIEKIINSDKNFIDFIYEEFNTLIGPKLKTKIFDKSDFIPIEHQIPQFPPLKICKLNLLRSITVQTSYKRIPYTKDNHGHAINIKSKDIGEFLDESNKKWYPGFESYGEGLFITFKENFAIPKNNEFKPFYKNYSNFRDHLLDEKNKISLQWKKHILEVSDSEITDWSEVVPHPLFVWLHTLSHALIKEIAVYAGYNVASLKERIYLNKEKSTGGILIYNTSIGSDGGMGGLIELTNYFDKIISKAFDTIQSCSNDPLCIKKEKTEIKKVGACCHSCLLISETSCEHRNCWLDRNIILD